MRLANTPIDAIYSSDLQRAYNTAKNIASFHALPVQKFEELREISFGKWEGMNYVSIQKKWPKELEMLFKDANKVSIPNGEKFSEVVERTSRIILKLNEKHKNQTIVIVSHGGAIRTILAHFLHIPLKHIWSIRQDNTAINILNFLSQGVVVEVLNDSHHLSKTI